MCEGSGGERVKGVREVMSKATDFHEEMRRLRRGGGRCEHRATLKNPAEKVNDVRRRSGGRRAEARKWESDPDETFEQQQEQSSTSQSNCFFFLVTITQEESRISIPPLP